MKTTRVGAVVMVVVAMLVAVSTAWAQTLPIEPNPTRVGGYFEWDGFSVSYRANQGVEGYSTFDLNVWSRTHRLYQAEVQYSLDRYQKDDGFVHFIANVSIYGEKDQTLNPGNYGVNLTYPTPPGLEIGIDSNHSYYEWEQDGKLVTENGSGGGGHVWPAAWSYADIQYQQWINPGEPIGFYWNGRFSGYFTDQAAGQAFLATVPEPTSLVLMGLLAAGMKFSRRRRVA